ncbi:MAG: phosphatase PAP2 family protein [Candidatus Acidiferrales bacterium]
MGAVRWTPRRVRANARPCLRDWSPAAQPRPFRPAPVQPLRIHARDPAIQRSGLPPSLLWLYSKHDYNLYAAFPSLHAGFPVVAAAAAWQRNRVLGALLYCWAVIVWLAVVYLGEHYVTDVVGGIAYAALAIAIVRTITARRAHGALAGAPGSQSSAPSVARSGGTTRSRSSR